MNGAEKKQNARTTYINLLLLLLLRNSRVIVLLFCFRNTRSDHARHIYVHMDLCEPYRPASAR